eukprot:m.53642 g.53642  ORF g.53642 m.53642 type:complete len:282 (+) comp6781_c0_seq1:2192-3037(+)
MHYTRMGVLGALLVLLAVARAAEWDSTGDGNWSDEGSWQGDEVPCAEDVSFPANGAEGYDVMIQDHEEVTAQNVTFEGNNILIRFGTNSSRLLLRSSCDSDTTSATSANTPSTISSTSMVVTEAPTLTTTAAGGSTPVAPTTTAAPTTTDESLLDPTSNSSSGGGSSIIPIAAACGAVLLLIVAVVLFKRRKRPVPSNVRFPSEQGHGQMYENPSFVPSIGHTPPRQAWDASQYDTGASAAGKGDGWDAAQYDTGATSEPTYSGYTRKLTSTGWDASQYDV